MKARKKATEPLSNFEWTMDDENTMSNMLQNGRTYKQIASSLGRSKKACQERASSIRRRMRIAGFSDDEVYKAFPSNYPRRNYKKRNHVVPENQPVAPSTVQPKSKAKNPRPLPTKERQQIQLMAKDKSLTLVVGSICAVGIWVIAGAFIYSLL